MATTANKEIIKALPGTSFKEGLLDGMTGRSRVIDAGTGTSIATRDLDGIVGVAIVVVLFFVLGWFIADWVQASKAKTDAMKDVSSDVIIDNQQRVIG